MKKILVACGTDITPSTNVAKKVGSLCKEKGIACTTVQCTTKDVHSKVRTLRPDLIIGSLEHMEGFDVPVLPEDRFFKSMDQNSLDELLSVLGR